MQSKNDYNYLERAIPHGLGAWLCAEMEAYRKENNALRARIENLEHQNHRAYDRIESLRVEANHNFRQAEEWQRRYLDEYEMHDETRQRLQLARRTLNARMNEGAWMAIQRRTERLHAAGFRTRNLLDEMVQATEVHRMERLNADVEPETEGETETEDEMEVERVL